MHQDKEDTGDCMQKDIRDQLMKTCNSHNLIRTQIHGLTWKYQTEYLLSCIYNKNTSHIVMNYYHGSVELTL